MSQQISNIPYNRVNYRQNNVNSPVMQGQQENPMLRAVAGEEDPKEQLKTFTLVPPMMIALYKAMEGFAKANSGAYEKSLSGRMANLGDKLAGSRVGKPAGKIFEKIGDICKGAINRSKILTALFKMPSVPENAFAKGLLHGTDKQLGDEFITFVNKYIKKGGKLADLGGLSQAEFETIKNLIGSDTPTQVKKGLNEILKLCDVVKDSKSVKLDNYLGRLTGRSVTLQQIGNQIRSVTKSTSKLGKMLPKIGIRGMHGITFGGGLFMLISAFSLAKAAVKAKKTEKGEKFKTFMEEFLSNISWVITMPLSGRIMNAFQGLANIGMTPAKLAKYRQALKLHNSTVFNSEAAWKASADALKAMRKTGKVGFLGSIARGIGRLFQTGREVVKPYINANPLTKGEKIANFFAKSKFFGKNALAYPIGFGIYMFLFSPIAEKIFVKISHAIFGKPKHSIYDEEPEPKEQQENPQQGPTAIKPQTNPVDVNQMSDSNLIKRTINGQYIPQNPNYSPSQYYQPTQYSNPSQYNNPQTQTNQNNTNSNIQNTTNNQNNGTEEASRSYIPSPAGIATAAPDTSSADAAIAQADKAEKQIHGIMANLRY